jgi:hypothetical protein
LPEDRRLRTKDPAAPEGFAGLAEDRGQITADRRPGFFTLRRDFAVASK